MDFNLRKDFKTNDNDGVKDSSKTLLQPQTVEINGCKFVISKMPCTVAQEVIFNLPVGLVPIISEFKKSEEQMLKMLSFCERVYSDKNVPLISKTIIDNHIPDFDTLIKLEYECIKYNYDFFRDGRALTFLNTGLSHAESKVSEILTGFLDKLSSRAKQP